MHHMSGKPLEILRLPFGARCKTPLEYMKCTQLCLRLFCSNDHQSHCSVSLPAVKALSVQPAAGCFDRRTVQKLLSQQSHHEIRYAAKNMVSVSSSDTVAQHLCGSRSMFLTGRRQRVGPSCSEETENTLWSMRYLTTEDGMTLGSYTQTRADCQKKSCLCSNERLL